MQMKYRANPRGRMDEPKVQLMRQVMIALTPTPTLGTNLGPNPSPTPAQP